MSDIFTLVSSREELDSLIEEQTGTAYNKPTESRNNGSRTSIAADDNDSFNILDFSDWLRICYMNSVQLIDKTIRSELLTDRSILNHLVISSLYTIRSTFPHHHPCKTQKQCGIDAVKIPINLLI